MNPLAETQIRSWAVHDVHFLNQLPALLEVLNVQTFELQEQYDRLHELEVFENTLCKIKGYFESQRKLQTIRQQHQNRLRYYLELQIIVNKWYQQARYSYQRAHCEFIDAALKEIVELCEKIVDLAIEKIETLTSKKQQKARPFSALRLHHSRSTRPPKDQQSENTVLFSDYGPSDIAFATISNDIEDIAGLLVNSTQNVAEVQKKRKTNPNPPTQESQKRFLQTWLCWGPEDCGVWIQM